MSTHRFTLEPYKSSKSLYNCPSCNKKTFTKYIDTENSEYLNKNVGKCSRVIKCNYHYPPKDYFRDNSIQNVSFTPKKIVQKTPILKTSYLEKNRLTNSLKGTNNFTEYLKNNLFGEEITNELIIKYNIGSLHYWNDNATIFWQVDSKNNIRTGKIMVYNTTNGKRIKKPFNKITWMHSILKLKDFNLSQCLFGEHLINEDLNKPIAIVESEKTAIICSVYLPDFIWLACGSVNNLSHNKTAILKGRNVVLFPDLKCYQLWKDKIPNLSKLINIKISNLLESKATELEKEQGYDIADYLINLKIDFKQYI